VESPDEQCWDYDTTTYTTTPGGDYTSYNPMQDEYDSCVATAKKDTAALEAYKKTATLGGGTLLGAGFVAMMVPVFHKTQPVAPSEVYRMVDEYNQNLRKELGIPEPTGDATPAPSGPPAWEMTAYAWVDGDRTGATLRVDF
jgi:hypothetical protein